MKRLIGNCSLNNVTLGACPSRLIGAKLLTGGLALALAFTFGCGRKATYKTRDGEVTVDRDGKQATIEATTKDGKVKFSAGQSVALPADFPKDVPIYQGATVRMAGSQGKGMIAMLVVSASSADAAKYYQDELKNQGWEIENTVNTADVAVLSAKKEQRRCTVSITKDKEGTMVNVVVEQGG